jgi:hypothetical protein
MMITFLHLYAERCHLDDTVNAVATPLFFTTGIG